MQVGNFQMNYRFYDAPSNNVVVFIHGIPTNSHLWDQVIPFLHGKFKLIAVDMIGYGKSDRASASELTLPKQADYVVQLLNKLGIPKAHFVGHDLGGGVVQNIAVSYPQVMKSMVIADGVAFANWPLPKVVSIRWPIAFEFEPSPLFIERMLREGLYYPQVLTPKIIENFVAPFSYPDGPKHLQQASLALHHSQTEWLVPKLTSLPFPTTLIWGQHDRYLVPYWGLLLHKTIPGSQLKILPNSGHYSMLDNPSLFANELISHLNRYLYQH